MSQYKKILCVRLDNMGDIIMSSPAISALKTTFDAEITLLTSSMGAAITDFVPDIDHTIVFDVPWVKSDKPAADYHEVVKDLKSRGFDMAVIFTVFSQNPLPAAMLVFLAGIPVRVSYCRENPYDLLTHWYPDQEPYSIIRHQVDRDMDLVRFMGAKGNDRLRIRLPDRHKESLSEKLRHQEFARRKGILFFIRV
jgi:ADP-heptose:LPS heptosyltransferase